MQTPAASPSAAEVIDRSDLPRSFLNTAWPLAAAGLILLMLVRACMPVAPTPRAVFDAEAITQQGNAAALAASRARPTAPALTDVIAALNRMAIDFENGADSVPVDAAEILQQTAALIASLPAGFRLAIIWQTDNTGDAVANQSLSLRRAEAVRAALASLGVPAGILGAEGRGDAAPVAGNDTEVGRFRNRRIEFALPRCRADAIGLA